MGVAFYIALEQDIPDFDPMMDGKGVSGATDELEAMAATLGVRPLMEFFSINPDLASEFLEEGGEMPKEEWFAASEGLVTVEALQTHLIANPSLLPRQEMVLEDLADMHRVLAAASAAGIAWCLAIDF